MFNVKESLLKARTLLGAPGIATRNKKLLGAPGIVTRSKDATRENRINDSWHGPCIECLVLIDKNQDLWCLLQSRNLVCAVIHSDQQDDSPDPLLAPAPHSLAQVVGSCFPNKLGTQ